MFPGEFVPSVVLDFRSGTSNYVSVPLENVQVVTLGSVSKKQEQTLIQFFVVATETSTIEVIQQRLQANSPYTQALRNAGLENLILVNGVIITTVREGDAQKETKGGSSIAGPLGGVVAACAILMLLMFLVMRRRGARTSEVQPMKSVIRTRTNDEFDVQDGMHNNIPHSRPQYAPWEAEDPEQGELQAVAEPIEDDVEDEDELDMRAQAAQLAKIRDFEAAQQAHDQPYDDDDDDDGEGYGYAEDDADLTKTSPMPQAHTSSDSDSGLDDNV